MNNPNPPLIEQNLEAFAAQFSIQYCQGVNQRRLAFRHFYHYPLAKKLLVLVNGRAENLLKWTELARDFYQQGFDVLLFDHRGQGYSERLLAAAQKGYVEQFDFYCQDMQRVLDELLFIYPYTQQFLLAHSLGALISAHYLANFEHSFQQAVFSAPFWGVPYKSPKRDKFLLKLMMKLGKGENYVFGKGPYQPVDPADNKLSHDAERMARMNEIIKKYPALCLGGPTFHWLEQCQRAIDQLPEILPKIAIPVLILQAEQEQIVNNQALDFYPALLPQGQLERVRGAKHEILFERDEIRQPVLNAILSRFA